MKPDKRQSKIVDILDERESATVEYLAEVFAVSHETIRRDLSTLYEQRLIRKVHGGAEKAQTASEAPFALLPIPAANPGASFRLDNTNHARGD